MSTRCVLPDSRQFPVLLTSVMNVQNQWKINQKNLQIIIIEPCCHVKQPTVAFILANIMNGLPVAIRQVLMLNPMP